MKRFDRTAEASSSDRTRVDAFLREWITDTIKPSMRPATAASYESVVEAHVIPAIGALRVAQLTPASVSRLYADLRDDGAGTRTLQKVHAVLHRAMSSAVTLGLIARNPAALEADVPKYRAPEREPLTAARGALRPRAHHRRATG
jgi:site-specific recombinase XerC